MPTDTLAGRLRALREAASLTQRQLADSAGVALQTLRQVERGERPDPRTSITLALARALGVTVEYLAGSVMPAGAKRNQV